MAELAREGIEAGALGFSTSRTRNHRTSTGAYTPTLTAAPAELIGIAEGIGASGTGVLQVVSDFLDVDDEFNTLREMVARSGRPLSISVARNPMVPDAFRSILGHITDANAAGLTMTGQVAPTGGRPDPRPRVHAQPVPDQPRVPGDQGRLAGRQGLGAARSGASASDCSKPARPGDAAKLGGSLISRYDLLFEMADEPDYEPSLGDSIGARAERLGTHRRRTGARRDARR